MAGTSRTALEVFYGELSGNIASQWGEDAMATIDDKLHMTETAAVQTVQGPVNWTNTSMMTFAGPVNATSTGINTFAGPFNATSTGINTWAGPANFSHTTGPHVFAGPLSVTTVATNTYAGPMDFNNTINVQGVATFQSNISLAGNFLNTATFSGAIDANSTVDFAGIVTFNTFAYFGGGTTYYVNSSANMIVNDFKWRSGVGFNGHLDHAISAARTWTFPNVTGTLAMWNADNATVTRRISIDCYEVIGKAVDAGGVHRWAELGGNQRAENGATNVTKMGVIFPDGITITALRIYGQCDGTLTMTLQRRTAEQSFPSSTEMASVTLTASWSEVSDISVSPAIIDNTTYTYYLNFAHTFSLNEARVHKIQIDYTVVRPQP